MDGSEIWGRPGLGSMISRSFGVTYPFFEHLRCYNDNFYKVNATDALTVLHSLRIHYHSGFIRFERMFTLGRHAFM